MAVFIKTSGSNFFFLNSIKDEGGVGISINTRGFHLYTQHPISNWPRNWKKLKLFGKNRVKIKTMRYYENLINIPFPFPIWNT